MRKSRRAPHQASSRLIAAALALLLAAATGKTVRPPATASGQPGQRRPRAARRLRGRGRARRRRPRAPSRRHRRRHRLRQAARPAPRRASSRCAIRRVTAAPTRCRCSATTPTPATTARRCASTPATSTSPPPARSTGSASRPGQLVPTTPVETVLRHDYKKNLRSYEHIAKPIAFDEQGAHVRAVRRARRLCQEQNRQPGAAGRQPCGRAGLAWRRLAVQRQPASIRPRRTGAATRPASAASWRCPGIRRSASSTRCSTDAMTSTAPGPASIRAGRARCCRPRSSSRSPTASTAAGRTYYYDQLQGKKKLNPEYGGDGEKVGDGDKLTRPLLGFPGHFAPNDLLFYEGDQFPERYRHGAFIAFHGSTIRMPYSQAGYCRRLRAVRERRAERRRGRCSPTTSPASIPSQHERRGGAADGPGAGARRIALRQRQRQGPDLADHVQGPIAPRSAARSSRAMAARKTAAGAHPHAR